MSFMAILIILFLISLAIIGHTVGHTQGIAIMDIITGIFTGGHVTG